MHCCLPVQNVNFSKCILMPTLPMQARMQLAMNRISA